MDSCPYLEASLSVQVGTASASKERVKSWLGPSAASCIPLTTCCHPEASKELGGERGALFLLPPSNGLFDLSSHPLPHLMDTGVRDVVLFCLQNTKGRDASWR